MRYLWLVISIFVLTSQFSPAYADTCDQTTQLVTTTPTPEQSFLGLDTAMKLLANIPKEADVALIGDSLIRGWEKSQDNDFEGRQVLNFGIIADRTQNVLWRYSQAHNLPKKVKAAVILIGTNNVSDPGLSACGIIAGINAVIDKTKIQWPEAEIFVLSIPPRGPDFKDYDQLRLSINSGIEQVTASNKKLHSVKLDDNFLTCGGYGKPALDRKVLACQPDLAYTCNYYKPDKLHFTDAAYAYIRERLGEVSKNDLGKDIFSVRK